MSQRAKKLVVLGSTGSVGRQTLDLIRSEPDVYEVIGLGAGTSVEELAGQAEEFSPDLVGVADEARREELADVLDTRCSTGERPEVVTGRNGLEVLASMEEADIVLNAVMGAAGLPGTVAGVTAGKRVALANKESLLIAGSIIQDRVEEHDAELIPVDSEHSSLFQLLNDVSMSEVNRLILTASGGPFRTWSAERIRDATAADALDHPTWDMGNKITIDSATLMNKAIELVEAKQLFQVDMDRLDVVVHPQSTVHAMLELRDGSMVAHMGSADMTTPIQYALTYPDRGEDKSDELSLSDGLELSFESPRTDVFPALELGYYTGEMGGSCGAAMNGANEVAVQAFLDGEISFPMIAEVVREVLITHDKVEDPDLDTLFEMESDARDAARHCIRNGTHQMKENTSEP